MSGEANNQRIKAGFKWKERHRNEDGQGGRQRQDRNLDQCRDRDGGYGERYRPRRADELRDRSRSPTRQNDSASSSQKDKVPLERSDDSNELSIRSEKKERKEKKEKKIITQEPMIIVHVNDRLGTKAAIPCLASDPIKLFKAQVAARIGREPHEIMLKRQGERPFKDVLTLQDYGVSNGVQLDLEVDTGD